MMKRKILISLCLALIICVATCLVACGGLEDYTGEVDITINLDKEYDGVQVDCPQGDVQLLNSTSFQVKLKNRLPVEILISCDGHETYSLTYTYEQLKGKDSITENIQLKGALYKFYFNISQLEEENYDVALLQEYEGVELKHINGGYVLESVSPIAEDIYLTIGKDYYEIPLYAEMFNYSTHEARLDAGIPVARKDSGSAIIYYPRWLNAAMFDTYNLTCKIHSFKGEDSELALLPDTFTCVNIDDYYLDFQSFEKRCFISADTLQNGYININDIVQLQIYKLKSNGDIYEIYGDYDVYCWTYLNAMLTTKPLRVGDKFVYQSNSSYFVHSVTAAEVENQEVDFNNDKQFVLANKRYRLNVTDASGNAMDTSLLQHQYQNFTSSTVFTISSDNIYAFDFLSLTINNAKCNYEIGDKIIMAIATSKVSVPVVNIQLPEVTRIVKKDTYGNVISDEIALPEEGKMLWINDVPGQYAQVDGKREIAYFKQIYGNKIELTYEQYYNLKLDITNKDEFEQGIYLRFSSSDGKLFFELNSNDTLQVRESHAGKTIQLVANYYNGYENVLCYVDVTIPTKLSNGQVIQVKIQFSDDEW